MSGILIEGKENVKAVTALSVAHAIALELNTGMVLSSRGSALDAARIQGLIPQGRTTRKAALKAVVKILKDSIPGYEPTPSIVKALGK